VTPNRAKWLTVTGVVALSGGTVTRDEVRQAIAEGTLPAISDRGVIHVKRVAAVAWLAGDPIPTPATPTTVRHP